MLRKFVGAAVIVAVLTGAAAAQVPMGISLGHDEKRKLTPEEQAAQEARETLGQPVHILAALAEELRNFRWDGVRLLISGVKPDRRRSYFKAFEKLGTVELFTALSADEALDARIREASKTGRPLGDSRFLLQLRRPPGPKPTTPTSPQKPYRR